MRVLFRETYRSFKELVSKYRAAASKEIASHFVLLQTYAAIPVATNETTECAIHYDVTDSRTIRCTALPFEDCSHDICVQKILMFLKSVSRWYRQ
jgi:hypothetical protein